MLVIAAATATPPRRGRGQADRSGQIGGRWLTEADGRGDRLSLPAVEGAAVSSETVPDRKGLAMEAPKLFRLH